MNASLIPVGDALAHLRDPHVHVLMASALAVLFGTSALHKLRYRQRFSAQLAAYQLLPARAVAPVALLLGLTEAALAGLLLLPLLRPLAGALAAIMLALYAGAIAVNLYRGNGAIDCGCGDAPVLLSPWLLLRNTLLILAALALTVPPAARALSWPDLLLLTLSLPVLLVMYRAMEQLLANASALNKWRTFSD